MDYRRSEIRAGIFLLASFLIFAIMVFAVSDVGSLFRRKKDVRVLFSFSDGIERKAPVRYSGMKIGTVKSVRVAPEHEDRIELTLRVYQDTVIKEDSRAAIKTLGLVGGKYVDITSGSPGAKPLAPGEVLHGEESLKIEDLTRAGLEVVQKLRKIADNLHGVLGDPAVAKSLKATISNLQEVSSNIKTMTSSKDEVAAALKTMPELLKKLDETATNLKNVTEKTDKVVGDNKKNIDATLENVKEMTKNLKETTEDVKKHPWKLLRKP
jgi:phospholipid/cholesterol/gamma-HCH transport system substrate-binding protein